MSLALQSTWMAIESLFAPASLLTWALRGVLLLLVAAMIVRVAFKASAASRHLIWALAMVALLLLPVLSATLPALQVEGPAWLTASQTAQPESAVGYDDAHRPSQRSNLLRRAAPGGNLDGKQSLPTVQRSRKAKQVLAPEQRVRDSRALTVDGPSLAQATDPADDNPSSRAGWLLPLWLIGLVGVAGWFALQHLSVRWLTLHAVEVEEGELVDLMHRLRRRIDLRRPVRLLMGHRTMMPMTWGIFRPVMLLPDNVADWPADRREDVLLHELAHIKRRDHLSQVLAQIGCAVHWFNPLTWYAVRRMTLEREHACDDYVLNSGTRPSDYATNLLEVARSMKRGPVTSMAAIAMAGRSTLKERLQAVLDEGRTRNTLGGRLATVALLLVAAVAIPLASLEIVTVEEVQAAGPKVNKNSRAPRASSSNTVSSGDTGYSYSIGSGKDRIVVRSHGGPRSSGNPVRIYHDGEVVVVPSVGSGEALAIFEDLSESYADEFGRVGEEIGLALRELQANDGSAFRYFAFDDDALGDLQDRLDELGESFEGMGVVVRPNGGGYRFNFDSAVVAPDAPRRPHTLRAPLAPRAPRPPRVPVFPQGLLQSFQVADGSWHIRGKGKSNWTWNDDDSHMSLRTKGDIEFNETGTDVESLSPGGYFEFEVEEDKTDYRVRFRADRDGDISRTWWVDGDKQPFDDEASKWMAQALPDLFRRTGFNAGPRVEELLKTKGVDGVLDEIDTLESDHVMRIYFGELLERARLDSKQYERIFSKAAEAISSDFEMATLLIQAVESDNLEEMAILELAKATENIHSDFEQHRVLSALVKEQNLSSKAVEAVLEVAMGISSDFELAGFLTEIARQYPAAYHSPLFLEALSSVRSDFEQRRVLTGVVEQRDLSPENLTKALEMAANSIHSDFELAEFLSTAARYHRIQGPAVAPYLDAMESISSDFEYRRAATAAIRRGDMDADGVKELVKIAGDNINSDFELSELLQLVADNYDIDGELREVYLDASDSIHSRHESQRALSAIDVDGR